MEIRGGTLPSFIRKLISFLICRLLHGASLDNFCSLEMYKYTNAERRRVYTFRRQKRISDELNKDATDDDCHALMDKDLFNRTFRAFVSRDWYDPSTEGKEELERFLSGNERFLMKPVLSSKGKGIELLYSKNVDPDTFIGTIGKKKVILEGFIHQHEAMAEINPSSVNTVRLITARCGNQVHIIHGGGLRCGGKDSFVDNFHNGGCAYPVDIETGIVDGPGVSLGSNRKLIKHPSSGVVMCGFQIPNWDKVLDTVRAAALVMERIGYIGWDIAILDNGCEIIEANINYPGTNIVQLDGFSAFEQVKAFLVQCKNN